MKLSFLEKFNFIKSFLFPFWLLLIWPLIFSFYFFAAPTSLLLNSIFEILIIIFIFLSTVYFIICLLKLVRIKKNINAAGLFIGFITTLLLMFFEIIILFGFGISGGATG